MTANSLAPDPQLAAAGCDSARLLGNGCVWGAQRRPKTDRYGRGRYRQLWREAVAEASRIQGGGVCRSMEVAGGSEGLRQGATDGTRAGVPWPPRGTRGPAARRDGALVARGGGSDRKTVEAVYSLQAAVGVVEVGRPGGVARGGRYPGRGAAAAWRDADGDEATAARVPVRTGAVRESMSTVCQRCYTDAGRREAGEAGTRRRQRRLRPRLRWPRQWAAAAAAAAVAAPEGTRVSGGDGRGSAVGTLFFFFFFCEV